MLLKQSYKLKILLALIVLAVACVMLAACDSTFRPEDNGYSAVVTYDANGGRFGTADTTGIKVYKYAPGAGIIQPGGTQTSQVVAPTLAEKHVIDWYPAILDEEGNVVRDNDGNIKVSDTPWNFSSDKLPETEGCRLYLVARWAGNFTFTVDVGEEARADGATDIVNKNYERPGTASRPANDPIWTGHTFYGYYDAEGNRLETESDWKKIEISEQNPNAVVYAHWIDGVWTIVRNANQLSSMMFSANYWLDADIDLAGAAISAVSGTFTGEFNGNGHTISNFNCNIRQTQTMYNIGLFTFGANSRMHDVTFENCTVTVTFTSCREGREYNVGFLCGNGSDADMSKLTNVGFIGCKLIIKTTTLFEGTLDANMGEGNYAGIFGKLSDSQTFTPAEGKSDVEVIDN